MSYLHRLYGSRKQLLDGFLALDGGRLVARLSGGGRGQGKVTADEGKPSPVVASSRGSTPPPGSARAIRRGCRCPAVENHHGAGASTDSGRIWYVFRQDCPLHGEGNWLDIAKGES